MKHETLTIWSAEDFARPEKLAALRVGDEVAFQLKNGKDAAFVVADIADGVLTGCLFKGVRDMAMYGGRRWWIAELADEATLRAATPPWPAIGTLAESTDSMGLCVFARSADPVYYLAVRAWVGAPGQFEDAASGAANATLAAWLASQDALPGDSGFYRISQGREVGHDAINHPLFVSASQEIAEQQFAPALDQIAAIRHMGAFLGVHMTDQVVPINERLAKGQEGVHIPSHIGL